VRACMRPHWERTAMGRGATCSQTHASVARASTPSCHSRPTSTPHRVRRPRTRPPWLHDGGSAGSSSTCTARASRAQRGRPPMPARPGAAGRGAAGRAPRRWCCAASSCTRAAPAPPPAAPLPPPSATTTSSRRRAGAPAVSRATACGARPAASLALNTLAASDLERHVAAKDWPKVCHAPHSEVEGHSAAASRPTPPPAV
jgi:hypothetical protein